MPRGMHYCLRGFIYLYARGRQKTKLKTPYPTLKSSFRAMLLFYSGGSREKSYEAPKLGGGGGGLGQKNFLENNSALFLIFFFFFAL